MMIAINHGSSNYSDSASFNNIFLSKNKTISLFLFHVNARILPKNVDELSPISLSLHHTLT